MKPVADKVSDQNYEHVEWQIFKQGYWPAGDRIMRQFTNQVYGQIWYQMLVELQ